ncbi:MAG: hydrogenase maturation nickel metallochaperone HypA [Gammaproteobacteria bacterium]
MSICQSLLHAVQRIASDHGDARIAAVRVRLGALCGVDPTLLARAFAPAARGSAVAGARLVVETAPVQVQCLECGAQSAVTPADQRCHACGATGTRLVGGTECLLVGVDLAPRAA